MKVPTLLSPLHKANLCHWCQIVQVSTWYVSVLGRNRHAPLFHAGKCIWPVMKRCAIAQCYMTWQRCGGIKMTAGCSILSCFSVRALTATEDSLEEGAEDLLLGPYFLPSSINTHFQFRSVPVRCLQIRTPLLDHDWLIDYTNIMLDTAHVNICYTPSVKLPISWTGQISAHFMNWSLLLPISRTGRFFVHFLPTSWTGHYKFTHHMQCNPKR
jgi:hypothetical protein